MEQLTVTPGYAKTRKCQGSCYIILMPVRLQSVKIITKHFTAAQCVLSMQISATPEQSLQCVQQDFAHHWLQAWHVVLPVSTQAQLWSMQKTMLIHQLRTMAYICMNSIAIPLTC